MLSFLNKGIIIITIIIFLFLFVCASSQNYILINRSLFAFVLS